MCLITEKLPEILKEDLIVYKLLKDDLTSIFKGYRYTLGVTYGKQELIADVESEYFFADSEVSRYYSNNEDPEYVRMYLSRFNLHGYARGYHFYTTKERARKSIYNCYSLVECIVPKGSTVVYDSTGLGVASQIKITKNLQDEKYENTYQK